jgi:hypothetical protein
MEFPYLPDRGRGQTCRKTPYNRQHLILIHASAISGYAVFLKGGAGRSDVFNGPSAMAIFQHACPLFDIFGAM